MKKTRFELFMNAVDNSYLEEAMLPRNSRRLSIYHWGAAAAACLVLCFSSAFYLHFHHTDSSQSMSVSDMEELGYTFQLPEEAVTKSYSLVYLGAENTTPVAQVTFVQNDTEFTYRALKSDTAENISGIDDSDSHCLAWTSDSVDMQLYRAEGEDSYVSWYSPQEKTQWCLRSGADSKEILQTAHSILLSMGLDTTVVPSDAADISYDVFPLDDLTVAETSFSLNEIRYSYHVAATGDVSLPFADISNRSGDYREHTSSQIDWCDAELYYTEGGAGKIIWFDIAPGLLYSVSMDTGASEQALLEIANMLFTPAQE